MTKLIHSTFPPYFSKIVKPQLMQNADSIPVPQSEVTKKMNFSSSHFKKKNQVEKMVKKLEPKEKNADLNDIFFYDNKQQKQKSFVSRSHWVTPNTSQMFNDGSA
jgi:hypothetical protein